jgi:hypothetical protein
MSPTTGLSTLHPPHGLAHKGVSPAQQGAAKTSLQGTWTLTQVSAPARLVNIVTRLPVHLIPSTQMCSPLTPYGCTLSLSLV